MVDCSWYEVLLVKEDLLGAVMLLFSDGRLDVELEWRTELLELLVPFPFCGEAFVLDRRLDDGLELALEFDPPSFFSAPVLSISRTISF